MTKPQRIFTMLASAVILVAACTEIPTSSDPHPQDDSLTMQSVAGEVLLNSTYAADGSWSAVESSLTPEAAELARLVRNDLAEDAGTVEFRKALGTDAGIPPLGAPSYGFVALLPVAYALAMGGYTVWSANKLIQICVPPLVEHWALTRKVAPNITSACFSESAAAITSKAVSLRLISPAKAPQVKTALKRMFDDVITNRKLQQMLNNASRASVTRIARDFVGIFYDMLVYGVEQTTKRYR